MYALLTAQNWLFYATYSDYYCGVNDAIIADCKRVVNNEVR